MKHVFAIILLVMSQIVWAADNVIETDSYIFTIIPEEPTLSGEVRLKITNKEPCLASTFIAKEKGEYWVSDERNLYINLYVNNWHVGERDKDGNCLSTELREYEYRIGRPDFDEYTRLFIFTHGYSANNKKADTVFNIRPFRNPNFNPESPKAGSIQSGVGLIRGWACDARGIAVSFDGGERLPVPYGALRKDTEAQCGDHENGYGMVFAWGLLGKGIHQMKTFIDGREVSDVSFEVVGLDDAFAEGLSGSYALEGFPAAGESVTVEWSEVDQNFIIVESP